MTKGRSAWVIALVIAIPYVVLLLFGILGPPFPNASFGAVSGWLSAATLEPGDPFGRSDGLRERSSRIYARCIAGFAGSSACTR